ncbi:PAS domain-containing protein [Novispirillum sp. DQ9]|uniref:PAS domain-containing protein n=1 Tax=Novispirillum sp. DQ9 TaxID=3398612 RepID=UPI003C7E5FC1
MTNSPPPGTTSSRSALARVPAWVGAGAITLVFLALFFGLWRLSDDRIDDALAAEADKVRDGFALTVEGVQSQMQALATLIAGDHSVQALFDLGAWAVRSEGGGAGGSDAAEARALLLETVRPQWGAMQRRLGARQLHFHLVDDGTVTSFLRVHAPGRFGDRLESVRHIIADVAADGRPRTGFEIGRIYSGLRGVVPVVLEEGGPGTMVGVLEAGTSFDVHLRTLDRQFGGGVAVLLRRDLVDETVWKQFMTLAGPGINETCQCYLEATSRPEILEWLRNGLIHPLKDDALEFHRVRRGDRTYNLVRFPLRDYAGTVNPALPRVGSVAVWIDRSALVEKERGALLAYGAATLGAWALAMGLYLWGTAYARRRRTAERALEAERALFAGGPVAVFLWRDAPGLPVEYASSNAAALIGRPAAELASGAFRFIDTVHPNDRERLSAEISSRLAEGRGAWEHSCRLYRRDGGLIWAYIFTIAERGADRGAERGTGGGGVRLRAYLVDQSRQHALQEEVARARHDLDFLLAASPAVTYSVPLGGTGGAYISPGVTSMLGYEPEEVVRDARAWWMGTLHPDDRPGVIATMDPAGWPDGTIVRRYRLCHADGSWRWVEDRCRVAAGEWGEARRLVGSLVDISARVELEQRLTKIAASLPGMIYQYQMNPDGSSCVPYTSDGIAEIYGMAPADVRASAAPVFTAIHPDDRAAVADSIADSLRTMRPWANEHRVQHPRKGEIWVSGHAMPERMADGVVLWHGFIADITDRKRAEAALRQSQERFELAVFGADLGVWDWDVPSGRVTFNERWAEMLGYRLDEIAPDVSSWQTLTHPDDEPDIEARLLPHLRGDTAHYECEHRLRHKDGSWVWVLDRGKVLERDAAGAPLRAVGTHLDITDRKRAEAAVQESEARYRSVIAAMAEGIVIQDRDGRIIDCNPAAERILGLPRDRLLGMTSTDDRWRAMHADGSPYPGTDHPPQRCLRDGGSVREDIMGLRKPGGDVTWISINAQPLRSSASGGDSGTGTAAVEAVVSSFTDITARHKAEQDLLRSNADLEQFAYVASHDLRQPLRMISSYLTLIERSLGPKVEGDLKDFLDFAVDGARRMDRLIIDLLEYSRIGCMSRPHAPLPLDEVVGEALRNLTVPIAESAAEVAVESPLPTVAGDHGEMVRLFQNLIGNAIKYADPGRPPRIAVTCARDARAGTWTVSVRDNGTGIDPRHFDRIFGVFQRLVTRSEIEGTGIGLAVCRKIAEHHGGRIWVESVPGEGSTFHVLLPDNAAPAP